MRKYTDEEFQSAIDTELLRWGYLTEPVLIALVSKVLEPDDWDYFVHQVKTYLHQGCYQQVWKLGDVDMTGC
jgi:hypothetical protein